MVPSSARQEQSRRHAPQASRSGWIDKNIIIKYGARLGSTTAHSNELV